MEAVKPLKGEVYWDVEGISLSRDQLSLVGSYSVLARTSLASTSLASSLATYSLPHMTMASLTYCDSARKTLTSLHCHDI